MPCFNPRALNHSQLAEIVADVQAILWQESRMLPDDPRQYGQYWNPAKEWDDETVEEIADVLDANELLWSARILAGPVRAGWQRG